MRDFELETYFSRWEFSARYHMTASDIESMSLSDLLALATPADREGFEKLWLGYTETWGAPLLRKEVSTTYETLESENVLCFAGAEEGVYAAMRVMLKKGDHAIVAVPNYQAAETVALDVCDVTGVLLDPADNWQIDVDALAKEIKPTTSLLSLNFPNNPTGAVLQHDRFDALIELCDKHGIYLFCDEVYRGVGRDDAVRLPQVADVYERGLSLNVMSKAYGLPGLRIGWIASQDKELLRKLERYKHYLSICNSAPSEQLALIALRARDEILKRNRRLVNENAASLNAFFAEFPETFEWTRPDSGCVGFPRLKVGDADQFCNNLVEETGVLLLPPSVYRSELMPAPTDRFRIGFGRKNIEEGLGVMRDYLSGEGYS